MKTIKTSELTGAALDWAVARCEGQQAGWRDRSAGGVGVTPITRNHAMTTTTRGAADLPEALHRVIDDFERRERGIPQAHIAAALVTELRAALAAGQAPVQPDSTEGDVFRALIKFLLCTDEALVFLRCWNEGNFDACRKEWPEAPSVLYPDTFLFQAAPAAQADSALEDAERYRWLRNPTTDVALVLDKRTEWVPPDDVVHGVGGHWSYEYRAGDELDAAIDAAIRAQKEGSTT